jgi:hypothetical protein
MPTLLERPEYLLVEKNWILLGFKFNLISVAAAYTHGKYFRLRIVEARDE